MPRLAQNLYSLNQALVKTVAKEIANFGYCWLNHKETASENIVCPYSVFQNDLLMTREKILKCLKRVPFYLKWCMSRFWSGFFKNNYICCCWTYITKLRSQAHLTSEQTVFQTLPSDLIKLDLWSDLRVVPRFWSRPKLSYDQTQSSAHPCVPRPKLQGLESGSSAQ